MQAFGLRFHHLGLAVPAPDPAFAFLEALGYGPGAQAFDPLQNVNLAMRHHAQMPDVEVIWPGARSLADRPDDQARQHDLSHVLRDR